MRRGFQHRIVIVLIPFFISCTNLIAPTQRQVVLCPESVARRVEDNARSYSAVATQYIWGAQDEFTAQETVKIDCSGLVVNCYRSAVRESGYELPFADASVEEFFERYSVPIRSPRTGDIVFMGSRYQKPTHMAIFLYQDEEHIYFIDATFLPEENVNGVSLRSYSKNDPRLRSFGRVLLKHR
jgi:hypothetical protein